MEIKEGMYVRFKDGEIGKITKFTFPDVRLTHLKGMVYTDNGVYWGMDIIGEPSYNIIDLIEVGDVIKHPILGVRDITNINLEPKEIGLNGLVLCIGFDDFEEAFKNGTLSIATKEQFSQMEYKVG